MASGVDLPFNPTPPVDRTGYSEAKQGRLRRRYDSQFRHGPTKTSGEVQSLLTDGGETFLPTRSSCQPTDVLPLIDTDCQTKQKSSVILGKTTINPTCLPRVCLPTIRRLEKASRLPVISSIKPCSRGITKLPSIHGAQPREDRASLGRRASIEEHFLTLPPIRPTPTPTKGEKSRDPLVHHIVIEKSKNTTKTCLPHIGQTRRTVSGTEPQNTMALLLNQAATEKQKNNTKKSLIPTLPPIEPPAKPKRGN